ncbi:YciI family protein [Novosphingobium aquiterrae]|uniref:YciI family protein n=1 Tax=Novosphingobium aquiterrae TaxID=624388 RepID=A0ABV6PE34_9SPHN
MRFFVVTMSHPDGPEWGQHVLPHVDYLNGLIAQGKLRASGPVVGSTLRSGLLLFTVDNRAELDALIAADPFAIEGLIAELTLTEWNPMFGAFASEAAPFGA